MSAAAERPELAVGAVVVSDDCLLLIRRGHGPAQGRWSIPSGRVERGETLAEAVVRELAEETGLSGVCSELIGWAESISAEAHFVVFNFEVILLDDRDPVAGDDAAEVKWVPIIDVDQYHLVGGLAEFLHDHDIIEIIA